VWVEEGNLDKTDYAMQSLKNSIRWDEERLGLELDLDRFMIVAVGDFNMGAMENKGLNIFNTKFVLANPRVATDIDFARASKRWSATNTSTTGPATASPAATGSSCR
jgi:aminopeptidase N